MQMHICSEGMHATKSPYQLVEQYHSVAYVLSMF